MEKDKHTDKLGSAGLDSLLEVKPQTTSVYYIELNGEAEALHTAEREVRFMGIEVDQASRLANFHGNNLQAINTQGQKGMLDSFAYTVNTYTGLQRNALISFWV